MYLNVTLVIQAVHFIIAYWLLRAFLFKPYVGMLQIEDRAQQALVNDITQKKNLIAQLRQKLEQRWKTDQVKLLQKKPELKKYIPTLTVPRLHTEPINTQRLHELIDQATQSLVKELDHVP